MKIKDLLALTPKLGDGELLTPQPSLENMVREYYARLVGPGEQAEIFTAAYLARIVEASDADIAAPTTRAEAPADPAPRPRDEQPREEAVKPKAEADQKPGESQPMRDPFDVLASIGIDLKVGGVDVLGGLKHGADGGSFLPLATGLMGVALAAVAGAEAKRGK